MANKVFQIYRAQHDPGPSRKLKLRPSLVFLLFAFLVTLSACSSLHHKPVEYVYVAARATYLHDRVAAVSNRVVEVTNGQSLEVVEHGKRFLKVKTDKNQIGWIEEHAVVDEKLYDQFQKLNADHKDSPTVATASVRDDLYLHVAPGRETEHLYLLAANTKVQLLQRATAVKAGSTPVIKAGIAPMTGKPATPSRPATAAPAAKTSVTPTPSSALPAIPPAPVQLEDWWLARDNAGHTGWLLSSRVDVDVPDEIGTFAEGQRTIGAYIIAKVYDPKSTLPNQMVPEYVTLMSPPKAGLPYDFDQVRVFTWSVQRHRYETAYRLHPITGYLPLKLSSEPSPERRQPSKSTKKDAAKSAPEPSLSTPMAPVFSFQVANGTDVSVDPQTGQVRPASLRTVRFMMIDTRVVRIGPDMDPIPITHLPGDKAKPGAKTSAKPKKRR